VEKKRRGKRKKEKRRQKRKENGKEKKMEKGKLRAHLWICEPTAICKSHNMANGMEIF
jgi:hypothetical protein